MYEPLELLKRVTGEGLNPKPYLGYLREKYSQVYNL
jgi:Zn-dependent M32 family carboxypeptidase